MATPLPQKVTMCYDGLQGDKEFVVACKGRPFSILTSPAFPTPTTTLVDYNLIRDLHLQMTDLQCAKFYYAGHKLRILGKVATSVQCLDSGYTAGNLYFKATVVEHLATTFDTHSIAGVKLSKQLIGPPFELAPTNSTEPTMESDVTTPPQPKKKKKKKHSPPFSPSNSKSPQTPPNPSRKTPTTLPQPTIHTVSINQLRTQAPSPCLSPAWTPSHNTGWTPSPHTGWTPSPHTGRSSSSSRSVWPAPTFRAITAAKLSPDLSGFYSPSAPVSAAIAAAQMSPDYCASWSPPGFPYPRYGSPTRVNISRLTHHPGHGQDRCTPDCRNFDDLPVNCGFHPRIKLPLGFQLCGYQCCGGYCECLRAYDDAPGYYG